MTRVFAILGPTASGKTELSIDVALAVGAEVISVDSMQVYRGMDIGTAKPGLEERRGIVHHMIDVADPGEEFSVAQFKEMGREILESSDVPLVISGGSGLHFRALVDPMSFAPTDPELREELEDTDLERLVERLLAADVGAASHVDIANKRRVVRAVEVYELTGLTPSGRAATSEAHDLGQYVSEVDFTAVGVDPAEQLETRIEQRLHAMVDAGLVAEVATLWPVMGRTAQGAVGYREIARHLEGGCSLDEAIDDAIKATRKLARRQRTWFRRDPRIKWIPWSEDPEERGKSVMEILT